MLPSLLRSGGWLRAAAPCAGWAQRLQATPLSAAATAASGGEGAGASGGAAADEPHHSSERDEAGELSDRVVEAALKHVKRLGWGHAALAAGARDLGLSPAAAGAVPGGDAGFVAAVVRRHNRRLAWELGQAAALLQQRREAAGQAQEQQGSAPPEVQALASALALPDPAARLAAVLRRRLELGVAPYIDSWPSALAALARPSGAAAPALGLGGAGGGRGTTPSPPSAPALLAELSDEALAAAGDSSVDIDWYLRRALVAGAYSSTELYMLTDFSPNFHESWRHLERRLRDADALTTAAAGAGAAARSLLSEAARVLGFGGRSGGGGGGGTRQAEAAGAGQAAGWQDDAAAASDGPAGTWPGTNGTGAGSGSSSGGSGSGGGGGGSGGGA